MVYSFDNNMLVKYYLHKLWKSRLTPTLDLDIFIRVTEYEWISYPIKNVLEVGKSYQN